MLLWLPVTVTAVRRALLISPTESFRAAGLLAKGAVTIASTTPEDTHKLFVDSADAAVRSHEGTAG